MRPQPTDEPGEQGHRARQSKTRGTLLRVAGVLLSLMPLGTLAFWVTEYRLWRPGDLSGSPVLDVYLVFVLPLLALYLGRILRRRGRLHLVKVISSPGEVSTMSFVLYLRSFEDDPELARSPLQPMHPPIFFLQLLISGRTEEEQIAGALKRVGPLVAVGAPGERRPYVGATRMYLPSENWKEPVRELMLNARLVVLALGPGEGVLWELVEAMRILPPERLVLLVPLDADEYERFKEQATSELQQRAAAVLRKTGKLWSPPSLPEYSYEGQELAVRNIKGAIYFSYRWVPVFVDLSFPGMVLPVVIGSFYDTLRGSLRIGLLPALRQLAAYERIPANRAGRPSNMVRDTLAGFIDRLNGGTTLSRAIDIAAKHCLGPYIATKLNSVGRTATTLWVIVGVASAIAVGYASLSPWIVVCIAVPCILHDMMTMVKASTLGCDAVTLIRILAPENRLHLFANGIVLAENGHLTPYAWTDLDVVPVPRAKSATTSERTSGVDDFSVHLYKDSRLLLDFRGPDPDDLARVAHYGGAGQRRPSSRSRARQLGDRKSRGTSAS